MKVIERYIPVALFIMLFRVILAFESINEIVNYDQSNESYRVTLSSTGCYYFAKL